MDDVGTFWINGKMVLDEPLNAVRAAFAEAKFVKRFGFFELAGTIVERGREVNAPDRK